MRSLVSSLILTLLLAAGSNAAQEPPTTQAAQHTFLVGFAQDTLDNDWRSAQVRELREALASYPEIRFIVTNAQGRTAQQILDIEDLADSGVDLLITSPRDGVAMAPVIGAVFRRGIPVVLLTRGIPSDDYTTFVAPDDIVIAAQAAEVLAERLNGQGRILVLQGVPTATTAIRRTRGFQQALEKYSGLEIVAQRVGNYLRADALHETEKVLADGITFDAIFAQSDSMAAGARMALHAADIDPRTLPIVGIDYIGEAREAIRNGEQLASFTYPTCAREGVQQVVKILYGMPFEREMSVDSVMVTRDNVERVEPVFKAAP
ncbi:MAG: substrate-binding domain-containing protein [Candidatus Thiodiazotropha sp. (ex Dulcina madagascariensis)]|nr:substrate-binding domain-containing protein [Candidatus Thiodiazotropha sp. (ex Dulcina madagascariensis)]MCU7927732.1 substrate-binding domain-containing protein [Candidatus Thiodiazotropha sp. (ex Dulcina madagascariensis)]